MVKKLLLAAAVSMVSVGLLLRLFTGQSDGSLAAVLAIVRHVVPSLLGVYALCQIAQTFFRALRYRILLAGSGEPCVPSFGRILLVTFTRNAVVDLLPARAGELSYLAMMNRGYRVRAETCLSSMAVSLLMDFAALAALVGLLLLLPHLALDQARGVLLQSLAALLAVSAVGAWLLFSVALRVGARLQKPSLSPPWEKRFGRLIALLRQVADAMAGMRHRSVLAAAWLCSLALRGLKYVGLYCLFLAVARPAFPALAGAPFWSVLTVLLASEGSASLPLPAFMGFGVYEAGGVAAMTWLGLATEEGLLILLALHLLSQGVDYLLGSMALLVFTWTVPAAAPRPVAKPFRRWPAYAAAALLAVGACVFAFAQVRGVSKLGALNPPGKGEAASIPGEAQTRLRVWAAGMKGFLVWSSNRYGNHEILLLEFPSLKESCLTSHPHVDTYPRLSPGGARVVFCRSQRPWVSQRDPRPWDVYLIDLDTRRERLLARNGNTPTWSEDGKRIVFQRHGEQTVEIDPATGVERVLFAAGSNGAPSGAQLQSPHYNRRTGQLAVTLRGKARATGLLDLKGGFTRVGGGCQLFWSPDREFLYYVDGGGRMKNAIYRYDPIERRRDLWLDLPEPYSHEYFPALSQDGRFLALGACAVGHEHDTADYEIFLWRVGSRPEDAVRVTWHTGNDCWPDLYVVPAADAAR